MFWIRKGINFFIGLALMGSILFNTNCGRSNQKEKYIFSDKNEAHELFMKNDFLKDSIKSYIKTHKINKKKAIINLMIKEVRCYNNKTGEVDMVYNISYTTMEPSYRIFFNYCQIDDYLVVIFFDQLSLFETEILQKSFKRKLKGLNITLNKSGEYLEDTVSWAIVHQYNGTILKYVNSLPIEYW